MSGIAFRPPRIGPCLGTIVHAPDGRTGRRVWGQIDLTGEIPSIALLVALGPQDKGPLVPAWAARIWPNYPPGAHQGIEIDVRALELERERGLFVFDVYTDAPDERFDRLHVLAVHARPHDGHVRWDALERSLAAVHQPAEPPAHAEALDTDADAGGTSFDASDLERSAIRLEHLAPPGALYPRSAAAPAGAASEGSALPADRSDAPAQHNGLIILGSCRYPGLRFDRERANSVFAHINRYVDFRAPGEHASPAHAAWAERPLGAIFMGDQIYADAYGDFAEQGLREGLYRRAYDRAFANESLGELARRVPVLFAIDDHEITNNWEAGAVRASDRIVRVVDPIARAAGGVRAAFIPRRASHHEAYLALNAYASYQWPGSPAFDVVTYLRNRQPSASAILNPGAGLEPHRLYYETRLDFVNVFVTDCRTQRHLDAADRRRLFGDDQLRALERWLAMVARAQDGSEHPAPALLVTSIAAFPLTHDQTSDEDSIAERDDIQGFPDSLHAVCTALLDAKPRHLIWVSGDAHVSTACTVEITREGEGRAGRESVQFTAIIASGLYAPMPSINARAWQFRAGMTGGTIAAPRQRRGEPQERGIAFAYDTHYFVEESSFTALSIRGDREDPDGFTSSVKVLGRGGLTLANADLYPFRGLVTARRGRRGGTVGF